jgi:hypothetical protein
MTASGDMVCVCVYACDGALACSFPLPPLHFTESTHPLNFRRADDAIAAYKEALRYNAYYLHANLNLGRMYRERKGDSATAIKVGRSVVAPVCAHSSV